MSLMSTYNISKCLLTILVIFTEKLTLYFSFWSVQRDRLSQEFVFTEWDYDILMNLARQLS